jgi:hypothetical protein
MNHVMKKPIWIFLSCVILSSCGGQEVEQVIGLRPIYGTLADFNTIIKSEQPKTLGDVGKIYVFNELLFINEVGKGVHVYDNTNQTAPEPLKFINIPGNVDIAIKEQFIYADLSTGMVTIDISDLNNVKVTDLDNRYLSSADQQRPPFSITKDLISNRIYFECVDQSKGLIINWEKEEMPKPACYIIN